MENPRFEFTAELWPYAGKGAWFFVTLPLETAAEIRFFSSGTKGFGSVRVGAKIGRSEWRTSIFLDRKSGSFVLPVKAGIRSAENLNAGDQIPVQLDLLI